MPLGRPVLPLVRWTTPTPSRSPRGVRSPGAAVKPFGGRSAPPVSRSRVRPAAAASSGRPAASSVTTASMSRARMSRRCSRVSPGRSPTTWQPTRWAATRTANASGVTPVSRATRAPGTRPAVRSPRAKPAVRSSISPRVTVRAPCSKAGRSGASRKASMNACGKRPPGFSSTSSPFWTGSSRHKRRRECLESDHAEGEWAHSDRQTRLTLTDGRNSPTREASDLRHTKALWISALTIK
ncbi:hypothetical protein SGPA1_21749 [Streptomyces misionensis JCM 4497]